MEKDIQRALTVFSLVFGAGLALLLSEGEGEGESKEGEGEDPSVSIGKDTKILTTR
jgi:hypothetical protein